MPWLLLASAYLHRQATVSEIINPDQALAFTITATLLIPYSWEPAMQPPPCVRLQATLCSRSAILVALAYTIPSVISDGDLESALTAS
jgi:hypothetical protein